MDRRYLAMKAAIARRLAAMPVHDNNQFGVVMTAIDVQKMATTLVMDIPGNRSGSKIGEREGYPRCKYDRLRQSFHARSILYLN